MDLIWLSKQQKQFLLDNSSKILIEEGRCYFIPIWFCETNEIRLDDKMEVESMFKVFRLDKLPEDLINKINQQRNDTSTSSS